MSETNAPEPTMEEILASIRRIISEDDAPTSTEAETATSPGDPPQPPALAAVEREPEPTHHHQEDDVLELTDRVEPEASKPPPPPPAAAPPPSLGDLDFAPAAAVGAGAAAASSPPRPAQAPAAAAAQSSGSDEPLVGAGAAGRAADHFGALASSIAMPAPGRTLEDVTRELLRPLLKEWLDRNLAAIVEARVQDEVERISRRRTY